MNRAMILLATCLALGACGEPDAAQPSGPCAIADAPQRFRKTVGGADKDSGTAVLMHPGGTTWVGGTRQTAGKTATWFGVHDEQGALLHDKFLSGKGAIAAFVATGDGTLILRDGFVLHRYTKDAVQSWERQLGGTTDADLETPGGALVLADGYLVVGTRKTGHIDNASRKARILRLDSDGNVVWDRLEGSDGKNTADGVCALQAGDFATVGFAEVPISDDGRQVWLRAADKDGNKLWEKKHGGALDEAGVGILAMQDQSLLVAASTRSKGAGENDLWVFKTSAQGQLLWDVTYGGESNDEPHSMAALPNGGAIIVGRHTSEQTALGGLWLVAVGTDGKLKWEKTYGRAWEAEGTGISTNGEEWAAVGTTSLNGAGGDDIWLLRGGPDGKSWCPGNTGAPCKGEGAETCGGTRVCDTTHKPPMCQPK